MTLGRETRRYRSPLREAQAAATRQHVLDAALRLFADRGYAATSITGIAADADVAPETVYAAFGSKRAIFEALIAASVAQGAGQALRATWQAAAGDPSRQLAALAESAREFWSTNRALVAILRQGTGEAELAGLWRARQRDRRALLRGLLADWPPETLPADLQPDRAVDLAFALTSPDLFHLLVEEAGWSAGDYAIRIAELLRSSLLGQAPR